jgi:hypothetical protein
MISGWEYAATLLESRSHIGLVHASRALLSRSQPLLSAGIMLAMKRNGLAWGSLGDKALTHAYADQGMFMLVHPRGLVLARVLQQDLPAVQTR